MHHSSSGIFIGSVVNNEVVSYGEIVCIRYVEKLI